MPKPNPSKTMPWPENLICDFDLPADTTPSAAEAFINGLPTTDRNKSFLRLRYIEGKPYTEIGPLYGITNTGVRLAVKGLCEKYGGAPAAAVHAVPTTAGDSVPAVPILTAEKHTADPAPSTDEQPAQISVDELMPSDEEASVPAADAVPSAPLPAYLKPIITAVATTTRQRKFFYDYKTRTVVETIPRGLRRDPRYIPLPDYYQIREYDLMQEFASSLPDSSQAEALQSVLAGVGPFKAFRSTVRSIGLGQAWADFRYARFSELASEWWEKNVADAHMTAPAPAFSPVPAENSGINTAHVEESNVLIVDPTALNGIALIETIRVLFRRVGPTHFEDALDELRDCLSTLASQGNSRHGPVCFNRHHQRGDHAAGL